MALGLAYTAKQGESVNSIAQQLSDDPVAFAASILANPGNAHITTPSSIPAGTLVYIGMSYDLIKPAIRAAFEADEQRIAAKANMTPEQIRAQGIEPYLVSGSITDTITNAVSSVEWNWKNIGLAALAIWLVLR